MTSSVIFIVGPTAVGKSEVASAVAKRIPGAIICCDAMQVYRETTIVSDKPQASLRAQVPHYLVDILSVTEDFNVALFRQKAVAAICEIQTSGKVPIIVGGSGFYMSVLLDGIFEEGAVDTAVNLKLTQELADRGSLVLHERLKSLDPQAALRIHPHDPQRVLRALTLVESTGKPLAALQAKREGLWGKMPIKIFCLNRLRGELYRRVEERVEAMFTQGLVDEVKHLQEKSLSTTASKMIGIPEVMGYLKGAYDLERAKYLMKLHTRHYVKRQLTWFRGDSRLRWINIEPDQSAQEVANIILCLCQKESF